MKRHEAKFVHGSPRLSADSLKAAARVTDGDGRKWRKTGIVKLIKRKKPSGAR
jgi:hypothetical protein